MNLTPRINNKLNEIPFTAVTSTTDFFFKHNHNDNSAHGAYPASVIEVYMKE